jgi:hypothetical protein
MSDFSELKIRIKSEENFIIKSCRFNETHESSKTVKIGIIQNSVEFNANGVAESKNKTLDNIEKFIRAAAEANVNILVMPELFCKSYFNMPINLFLF